MESKSLAKSIILGLSILIGLCMLGFFTYRGLKTFSDKDRIVTVKGLAEMKIEATSAFINIDFSFSGDNLQEVIKQVEGKKNQLITYLTKNGYPQNKIGISNMNITDRKRYYETRWENGQKIQEKVDRYSISQNLTVQSAEVKTAEDKKSKMELDLISNDLTSDLSVYYNYPDLNSIKPQLIAESTKNARIAGEQFANDSKAKLGKIKTASQGQITIAGNYSYDDEASATAEKPKEPYMQKVRVVSTIVFFLE
jgi:uncharacterized protein